MEKSFTLDNYKYLSEGEKLTRNIKQRKKTELKPSEYAVRNILNYSRAVSIFQTHNAGLVTLILN
jgi:hypothetical protein